MTLRQIRLELARSKDFPGGNPRQGYVLRAPLAADGRLDARAFRAQAQLCTVHRFAPNAEDQRGQLINTRKGWAISYAVGEADDEAIHRLGAHVFKVGEYVTVTEPDGDEHTFRVAAVGDVPLSPRMR